jgi:MFS family permease
MSTPSIDRKGSITPSNDSVKDVEKVDPTPSPERLAWERKIIRRVDLRLLPLLGLLYSFSLIDRTNLASARQVGMAKDLKLLVGDRYSIVSCLFFVPFVLFQIPGNIFVRKFGAKKWMAGIAFLWGVVELAMGWCNTWVQLLVLRILLGLFEASFFPAMMFIITTWYRRHEVQQRIAVFYVLSSIAGGFSPIIAYGISLLNGKQNIAGWSWIFIIEGAFTIFLALTSYMFIPDFPDKNTFLTQEETKFCLDRVEKDRGDALPDELTTEKVLTHLSDWTMWAYGLMYMCATIPPYLTAYFNAIILASMGFNTRDSLLLTAPPYAFSCISAVIFAYFSDKMKLRAPFIAAQTVITIVGLLITSYAKQAGPRYFGVFLSLAGGSGSVPGILAYSANNIVSHSKRSVSTGLVIAFGGIGGIIATTIFRQHDYPRYLPGFWATIGFQIFLLFLLAVTSTYYTIMNRKARDGTLKEPLEGQPGFLYTL